MKRAGFNTLNSKFLQQKLCQFGRIGPAAIWVKREGGGVPCDPMAINCRGCLQSWSSFRWYDLCYETEWINNEKDIFVWMCSVIHLNFEVITVNSFKQARRVQTVKWSFMKMSVCFNFQTFKTCRDMSAYIFIHAWPIIMELQWQISPIDPCMQQFLMNWIDQFRAMRLWHNDLFVKWSDFL